MMKLIADCFTDAKGRAEIKVILGAPVLVAACVYGVCTHDWGGFAALSGLGLSLIGGAAVTDAITDAKGA